MKSCNVVLTFESVNESYRAVLFCGTVYHALQSGFHFCVCGWNPMVWPNANESYWAVLSCGTVYMLYKVVLTFESVDEILKCDHRIKTSLAVLLNGAICLSAFYKMKL